MKKVLILGTIFGEAAGLSKNAVVDAYRTFYEMKYGVYPMLIIGIDDLEEVINKIPFDGVFVMTYGNFGNNGFLQKVFEDKGIKFNNSGSYTHEICYNKLNTAKFLKKLKLNAPEVHTKPVYPCIIKPIEGEGSHGIHVCRNSKDYNKYINEECFSEEFIRGDEYTISIYNSIVGNPIKITKESDIWGKGNPSDETLDYDEKAEIRDQVFKDVLKIYKEIKATDGIRIDFIIRNSKVYYIDINSMPVLNRNGYFHRSLMDYDNSYDFDSLLKEMYKNLIK